MAHRKIGKRRSKTSNLIGQRMCIVSRKSMHHSELLRFVRADNGRVIFDTNNNASGRGAYICPDAKYIKLAAEKKYFQKAFGTAVLVDAKQLIKQTIELLKTKTTNKIGIAYRIGLCKIASVGVLVFEKSPLSTKLIQDFEKLNFLRSSYEKYYQGV